MNIAIKEAFSFLDYMTILVRSVFDSDLYFFK